jgi:hypothetical protein
VPAPARHALCGVPHSVAGGRNFGRKTQNKPFLLLATLPHENCEGNRALCKDISLKNYVKICHIFFFFL